jgi:hypothetical protein
MKTSRASFKRELFRIFIASAGIYYVTCFILSGFGLMFAGSPAHHQSTEVTAVHDEIITGNVPHRVIKDPKEFSINTGDREERVVYLFPGHSLN